MTSCDGTSFFESFGNQTLYFCHLDGNQDAAYQSSSDNLAVWHEDRWYYEGSKTFQDYKDKFGLPNFEGISLVQWQNARNFVHLHRKELWNVATEKKLSDVAEYHVQKGISLKESTLAGIAATGINFYAWPSPSHQVDLLTVTSVLHYIKAKMPLFYRDNQDVIDLISQKISDRKLNFVDENTPGGNNTIQGEEASYDMITNSMHLVNPRNLELSEFDGAIAHELMHFFQDILGEKISFNEAEVNALLFQAEFLLSQSGLINGPGVSPENLEKFIKDYRGKQRAFGPNGMNDEPVIFALRKVYYEKHQDKQLEDKNLEDLLFSQENLFIMPELARIYSERVPIFLDFFKKKYPHFKDENLASKLDIAGNTVQRMTELLDGELAAYSTHLNSSQKLDAAKTKEYQQKILIYKCAVVFFSKEKLSIQGASNDEVKAFQQKLFFEAIKWAAELFFNKHLYAPADGVE